MNKSTLLDIVLLPKKYYLKFTEKKWPLILGMLMAGIFDIAYSVGYYYDKFFTGKSQDIFYLNIALTVSFIIFVGVVDVLIFCYPLKDLVKFLHKKAGTLYEDSKLVEIMKVYLSARLLLYPFELAFLLFVNSLDENSSLIFLSMNLLFVFIIWFCAVITRGIGTIFNLEPISKKLLFVCLILWNFIFELAFGYVINFLLNIYW